MGGGYRRSTVQMRGVEPLYCKCKGRHSPIRVKTGTLPGKTEPFLRMKESTYGGMEGTKPETNNVRL